MTSRPATPTAETPLGTAVLSERIGAGGAADVFRCVVGGVPLAVKVLRTEFSLDREMMDRFAQEVAVVDALRHAGIPECYGHGFTSDGRPFAAFALVTGETLRDRINRGPLLLADGLRVLDDVLEILILAHQKGIAHRDIKPSNIMLGPGGLVHLLDFGLAKLFEARGHDEAPISTLGVPLGTPSYMAPEQALGIRVTNAADLFGLSLTIATSLAGRPLRTGTTQDLLQGASRPFPPLRTFDIPLPIVVEELLDRALSFAPSERFTSAEEMQRETRIAGRAVGVRLPFRPANDSDIDGITAISTVGSPSAPPGPLEPVAPVGPLAPVSEPAFLDAPNAGAAKGLFADLPLDEVSAVGVAAVVNLPVAAVSAPSRAEPDAPRPPSPATPWKPPVEVVLPPPRAPARSHYEFDAAGSLPTPRHAGAPLNLAPTRAPEERAPRQPRTYFLIGIVLGLTFATIAVGAAIAILRSAR
jgi:serine/threonine-protein kinase